jgi:5'-3' exonuclease
MKLSKGTIQTALIDVDIMLYRASWKHEGGDVEEAYETIDAMFDNIFYVTHCHNYIGFLTGKGNFRKDIAKTKEYKGNRKDNIMPEHFQDIRDYLINEWSCIVTEGIEADDALGICQTNMDKTIICSIDKDLLQIKGYHYNWNRNEVSLITEHEADKLIYKQTLMGDSTDNIVGIPRCGDVKSDKILAEGEIEESYEDKCKNAYLKHFEDEELSMDMFKENYSLVYIAREVNDDRFASDFKIPEPTFIF